ncbi:MAG: hypothetical protein M1550_03660, partial [Deltaproteobacteria bacterium]|nr:hypothetical protein [Deltaproteobacteria bacterium]
MIEKTTAGRLRRAALLIVTAGILLPAFSVSDAVAESPVRILAPRDGATLPPGNALLIGKRLSGHISRVEVEVNGRGGRVVAIPHGAFRTTVTLAPGRNVIRVTAGESHAAITVSASAKGRYRYHPDVEKCAECHGDGGKDFAVTGPKDGLCYKCHDRKDGKKHVHGPLGGGDCTSCHDPHGSENGALTVAAAETLCRGCHDQKSSERHVRNSRGKSCTAC